jgi:subtilisin-like proprotein convertase family protein
VPIVVANQVSQVTDLNVTLNFQHQWLGDLDVFLISPGGKRVELFSDLANNGTLMTNTVLDDQADFSILTGSQPYTGRFMPEGALSEFISESTAGTWLLEVNDDNSSDIGRLLGWSMTMNTLGLAPVTVTLQTSRADKAAFSSNNTITVVIPANQSEVLVSLDAVDNALLDGTTTVTIEAISASASDFGLDSDTVDVTDAETMNLALFKTSVFENAGPGAVIGKLTRGNTDISLPYTVMLTSSNTNKLTVPASVTIPANKSSVTFPMNAIDNNIIDGNTLVTVTAMAPAYGADVTALVNVLDLEPVLKLSTSTPTVAENLGSFTVVVERQDQADLSLPMTVTLTTGAGLTVPATVTIPANNTSVSFEVSVLDNSILDGARSVTIHAAAGSITDGDLVVTITDHETLTINASKTTFLENAGGTASTGTVTRSNTGDLSQALLVTLTSSDTTEATVPATVTIPAGQASVSFQITAVNDPAVDGAQNVTVTATAASFVDGTIGLVVEDHEPPVISGPDAATSVSRPTISWNALAGAIRYDVWISNLSSGVDQIVRKIDVPTNSFVPPENLGIGQYRVWVRAINSEEVAGFWSVGKDFFVNTPPVITSPSPAVIIANSSFPTITWSAVPDATKYELWVNNLTTKRARVIYLAGTSALTTTSYTTPLEMPSGTYKIWVRALNAQGEAGLWSVGVVHTVLAPPAISQPIGGGTFDRTPTFSWTAVTGATNYDLWVGDAKTGAVAIRNQFIKATTFTALQDIAVGDYKVWVRAQSGNSYSSWSQVTRFSVGLPPAITSAKLVGNPARAQFAWTTIAGTEKYELRVTNKTTSVLVFQKTAIITTAYTHNATLPAGTYRVWVRAVSTMGEVTTWSSPVDLVIASAAESFEADGSGQSAILTSAFPKAMSIENESPIESPEAVVEDTLSVAEARVVVNDIDVLDVPAAIADPAIPSVDVTEAEFDAVMAEWQSADWWIEPADSSDRNDMKSVTALAASIGLFVHRGKDSEDRRKKRF